MLLAAILRATPVPNPKLPINADIVIKVVFQSHKQCKIAFEKTAETCTLQQYSCVLRINCIYWYITVYNLTIIFTLMTYQRSNDVFYGDPGCSSLSDPMLLLPLLTSQTRSERPPFYITPYCFVVTLLR